MDAMQRQIALSQYYYALKLGQKYHHACVSRGKYPYPQVLNEVFSDHMAASHVNIGTVDIPMDRIVGTTTLGRKNAFAGNFMPLLTADTEFASKWINLCQEHLGPSGIHDPIVCYEYMGYFYVTEGNKRVSVLKSYDAPAISARVTRIVPAWSQDHQVQLYYEFMPFFQLSGLYDVTFSCLGSYTKLQARLGFEPDHVWTKEERLDFVYGFRRFKAAFEKVNTDRLDVTPGDALLIWLQVNPASDLEKSDLVKSLTAVWPDVRIFANGSAIEVSTSHEDEEDRQGLMHMLGIGRITHLNVAFVHAFDPARSGWTAAHEKGRKDLEKVMGDKLTVRSYFCGDNDPLDVMEQAVSEGAQVIFATTPPMISACRQIAARYPQVRVLNCSLSMPYSGVRTYYSRMFEAKFITGAIAGAMATEDVIGYVANYPIIGTVTAINAFALGVRITNPRAKVALRWSCVPGNPVRSLLNDGVSVISNRDGSSGELHWAWEWGTYKMQPDGALMPLASPRWNWGKFYELVIQSIFDGNWSPKESQKAVNYWWGMNSGVINVDLSDELPLGTRQLANILMDGVCSGALDPFEYRLVDQQGNVRSEGDRRLTVDELMYMDWLLDNVEGSIPEFDELLPVSQQLVRILGLKRNQIPPVEVTK